MTHCSEPARIVDHDLHVHTFLSTCCSDPQATPEKILARAAEVGLRTVGFADHMWDRRVPGASEWYRPQSYEHIRRIREHLPADTRGVRVLVGCETEYCGRGKVGISPEVAEQLDFVLVPMSHLHMRGFTTPPWVLTSQEVADKMVRLFNEVVELETATGIAHPFLPLGYKIHTERILSLISDNQFADCFGRAAERGISLEITTSFFPSLGGGSNDFRDETFGRVLSLAKQAGCVFHFASDAHGLARIGRVLELEPYLRTLGITREDLTPLVR